MARTITRTAACGLSSRKCVAQRSCLNRKQVRVCSRSSRLDVQAVRLCRAGPTAVVCNRDEHRIELATMQVIPMLAGDANEQTPPDLPSYLFKERIVYLGMSLVPAVTELMMAELLYLQYDNPDKPINVYINSTGVTKGGPRLGYESEAFAIYDVMKYVKPPLKTLCVGTAFGEAAMLLAAGEPGLRGALPSATIMLRQPIQRFQQMQASDIDIYRNELRKTNSEIVRLLSKHTGQEEDTIKKDINRPKYFSPYDAVEYGIIDKVLESGEAEVGQALRQVRKGAYEWNLTDQQ